MTNELPQDASETQQNENAAVESTETNNAAENAAPATPTDAGTQAGASESTAPEAPAPPTQSSTVIRSIPKPASMNTAAPAPASAPAQQPSAPTASKEDPIEEMSMGDIDFGAILEQFEQEQKDFHQGDLVEGKVVGITDRGVLVDFGYKSEGFVPVEEFTDRDGNMTAKVGDSVEVTIRSIHGGDSAPQLSRFDAVGRKVWDDIEQAFNSETPIVGKVVDKTKGGLRVDINGVEAFLPGSQIDSRPIRSLDTYIGQDIEAKIIKFSRRRNNIVLSRKVITDLVVNEQKAQTLGSIEIGYIVNGTIKNLTEYGAFVDIGGIDGLLHVTDMSWGRIHHPGDQFKVGEEIQVKVLKLDREKEKISLGYKQLLPDPWSTVVEVYPVNSKMTGTVSSVTEYGVFVELEPGVEGLVHVSEISWSRRAQSPKKMFHKGQQVEVQVLGVDTVEKRISLGMKQFQENPWDSVDIKYPIGAKVQGRVRNLTDFGAFVELEEGIDGLVHVSDISWAKKIKHPKDVLKKDQEVEAVVTNIDKRGQRLSLSMKDLTPSAWEGFVATHRPGDTVKGKVSRFTNFGVFVELEEGLEGLCHISELSDERVESPESVVSLGQELDFKILRIEPSEQKIGLSHRAVGKGDSVSSSGSGSSSGGGSSVDTRMYSSEAKGGMASLGELAKLRFGGGEQEAVPAEDPEERKRAKAAAKEARAREFAAREAAAAEQEANAESGSGDVSAEADQSADAAPQAEETSSNTEANAAAEAPAGDETSAVAEDAPADNVSPDEAPAAETSVEDAPSATSEVSDEATAQPAEEAPAAETEDTATAETQAEPAAEGDSAAVPAESSESASTNETGGNSDSSEEKSA
jgi:small subunit ribosomal protein S1